MKKVPFIIFALLSMSSLSVLHAQWAHVYGSSEDRASSMAEIQPIQRTRDGGFVVLGTSLSIELDNGDFWLLKLSPSGEIEWQRTYGGGSWDTAYAVDQTREGGYILTGITESFGASNTDIWVLKVDSLGDIEWQRRYGGPQRERGPSVKAVDGGGYIVAAPTESFGAGLADMWLAKINSSGDIEWQRTYGGSLDDWGGFLQQTNDGGIVVAGFTESFGAGDRDIWVLKLDSSGNIEWQNTYEGPKHEVSGDVQLTSDGGYVVTGLTFEYGLFGNISVLKLKSTGDIEWQRAYGGGFMDYAWSIQQTRDEGYIVAGYTESFDRYRRFLDATVIKLDASGDIEWGRTFGGGGDDLAWQILQADDGGYFVAGHYQPVLHGRGYSLILKLAANGDIPNCELMGFPANVVHETGFSPASTNVAPIHSNLIAHDTNAIAEGSDAVRSRLCPVSMSKSID